MTNVESATTYHCPICGSTDCNDKIAKVPLGIAGRPSGSGVRKSGRFHTTTERVFRGGRLVVGINQTIPWEEAQALGLVEADLGHLETPMQVEPPATPPPPADDKEDTSEDEEEQVVETAKAPPSQAAIRRRSGRKPGQPAKGRGLRNG